MLLNKNKECPNDFSAEIGYLNESFENNKKLVETLKQSYILEANARFDENDVVILIHQYSTLQQSKLNKMKEVNIYYNGILEF